MCGNGNAGNGAQGMFKYRIKYRNSGNVGSFTWSAATYVYTMIVTCPVVFFVIQYEQMFNDTRVYLIETVTGTTTVTVCTNSRGYTASHSKPLTITVTRCARAGQLMSRHEFLHTCYSDGYRRSRVHDTSIRSLFCKGVCSRYSLWIICKCVSRIPTSKMRDE